MKKILFILLIIATITGCSIEKRQERRCRKCENSQIIAVHDTVKEAIRDTFMIISPDTSNFWALLECNEQNDVLLRQIKNTSTQGIKTIVSFKRDTLIVTSTIDSAKVWFALKDKFISKNDKESKITVLPPVKIKYISFVQYCYISLFIILAFVLGVIFSKQVKNIFRLLLKL